MIPKPRIFVPGSIPKIFIQKAFYNYKDKILDICSVMSLLMFIPTKSFKIDGSVKSSFSISLLMQAMNDDLESHSKIFASKTLFSEAIGIFNCSGIGMLVNC